MSFYIRSLLAHHGISSFEGGGRGVLLTHNLWTPSTPDQINYIMFGIAYIKSKYVVASTNLLHHLSLTQKV